MLILVFLLTLPFSLHSILCPCDTTPNTCDTHCCCDISCSAEQILTFTCATFTLSDSKLCCKDQLTLSSGGVYQSVRKCSSNIVCLENTPSSFGQFSNSTTSEEVVFKSELGNSEETVPFVESTQYRDSDLLLQTDGVNPPTRLMFPVQFHGDLCALSPVLFYSQIQSSCRKKVDVTAFCKAGDMLDFNYYLKKLLAFPDTSATAVDLSENIVFYCLDAIEGVKETCSPANTTPEIKDSACINAVSEIEIRLGISPDSMVITGSTVTVTLTSFATSLTPSHISQKFSITYKPASQVDNISGNFGYTRGSHILSGYVNGASVVMNSDSSLRVLSLFSSTDCSTFTSYAIKFGTGYYTGCKLELPFYNFEVMSDQLKEYCTVIRNISGSVFESSDGVVVGSTGSASTTDPSQWVYVRTQPDAPTPSFTGSTVKCDDVTSHKTYKIFYTEVGVEGNLQAVITRVKVQYSTQTVVLYCSNAHCSTNKQQYIVLSNSVQFIFNPPEPRYRYKVNPRTTALLPLDFFYPLTGAGMRWGGGVWWGALVWWGLVCVKYLGV